MPESPLRLIKRCAEYKTTAEINDLGFGRRGIYVLYRKRRIQEKDAYTVVYIGLATRSMRSRLYSHRRTKRKLWTHFSAYEVWDNIRDEEIIELEGLFRQIYWKDPRASKLNVMRGFKKIWKIRENNLTEWPSSGSRRQRKEKN